MEGDSVSSWHHIFSSESMPSEVRVWLILIFVILLLLLVLIIGKYILKWKNKKISAGAMIQYLGTIASEIAQVVSSKMQQQQPTEIVMREIIQILVEKLQQPSVGLPISTKTQDLPLKSS